MPIEFVLIVSVNFLESEGSKILTVNSVDGGPKIVSLDSVFALKFILSKYTTTRSYEVVPIVNNDTCVISFCVALRI